MLVFVCPLVAVLLYDTKCNLVLDMICDRCVQMLLRWWMRSTTQTTTWGRCWGGMMGMCTRHCTRRRGRTLWMRRWCLRGTMSTSAPCSSSSSRSPGSDLFGYPLEFSMAVAFSENLTRWSPLRMKEWNKLLTIPVKAKEEVDKYKCILWWGSYKKHVQLIKKEREVDHLCAVAQVLYGMQAVSWSFIYLLKYIRRQWLDLPSAQNESQFPNT